MKTNAYQVNPKDNVVVAVREIEAGERLVGVEGIVGIEGLEVIAREAIMRNHKVAVREIPAGAPVIKYGEEIGLAATLIRPGDWVHTHNLRSREED